MAKTDIKNLSFTDDKYPNVIAAINELTDVEQEYFKQIDAGETNPHATAARLIENAAKIRINELREKLQSAPKTQ